MSTLEHDNTKIPKFIITIVSCLSYLRRDSNTFYEYKIENCDSIEEFHVLVKQYFLDFDKVKD